MMVNIITSIDIKQRKLRDELSKQNPNKDIVKRLEDSIHRHKKEMKKRNKRKKARRRIRRRGARK